MNKSKKVVNFLFEANNLKRIFHAGWLKCGVKTPDTLAEHMLLASQIGYILAVMEGDANPERVACILMIHDNAEIRIGDQDKVGAIYFNNKEAEHHAFSDQLDNLPLAVKEKWQQYFHEFEERDTKEGLIAKDADYLELAFQAKEYVENGNRGAQAWIDSIETLLKTESAKKLLAEMKSTSFNEWHIDLINFKK